MSTGTAALVALMVMTAFRAQSESEGRDFWSVAVPGLLTGFGTLALAVATVWFSITERRRDDYLRSEQRRQLEEQATALADAEAFREARKVFAYSESRDDIVKGHTVQRLTVVNAGPDPIFNVGMGGTYDGKNANPSLFWWHGVHQIAIPYVLSGERGSLNGEWREGKPTDSLHAPVAQLPYWAWEQLPVWLTWTDARGLRWERTQSVEPHRVTD